jgi:sugar phosphate isomerase/epimerase
MGYPLDEALDLVRESGFDYAELSSIVNMCEHIDPKFITPEYADEVKRLLDSKGIKCYAVSGHVDLTIDEQFHDFLKKIEFAGRIGAKIINTNSGPKERLDVFKRNMPKIIAQAEKWNVVIGLESHGDIIHTAQESAPIFREYSHPLVRLNYDTGNTLFYCNGNIKIEEDIKYGLEYLHYIHLKDIVISGGHVQYCPIGDGDVDFPAVFEILKELERKIPCGLEIPVHVRGVLGAIKAEGTPMPKDSILEAVRRSVAYMEATL